MDPVAFNRNLARAFDEIPQLRRGVIWCHKCGYSTRINAVDAMRNGWPLHCGETMSIDSPEERKARP